MTIQRTPHPGYAIIWTGWYANIIGALMQPEVPLYGLAVLLLFFPIELSAHAWYETETTRATLSTITTWAARKTTHHRLPLGFGAVLAFVILTISWLLGRTVTHYAESATLGILSGLLCVAFLWPHLMDPDVHG